jgi:hypothetical protein
VAVVDLDFPMIEEKKHNEELELEVLLLLEVQLLLLVLVVVSLPLLDLLHLFHLV